MARYEKYDKETNSRISDMDDKTKMRIMKKSIDLSRGVSAKEKGVIIAVFLGSLPLWYIVGFFAIMSYGFLVWIVPFALSLLGIFLPYNDFIFTEFDGPILLFTLFASIQNALMTRIYLIRRDFSKFIRVGYWIVVSFFLALVALMVAFIVSVYGIGEILDMFTYFS